MGRTDKMQYGNLALFVFLNSIIKKSSSSSLTLCGTVTPCTCINIRTDDSLLPDGTKPSSDEINLKISSVILLKRQWVNTHVNNLAHRTANTGHLSTATVRCYIHDWKRLREMWTWLWMNQTSKTSIQWLFGGWSPDLCRQMASQASMSFWNPSCNITMTS